MPEVGRPSPLRAFLIGIVLILVGILIGVLAYRFVPLYTIPAPITPTVPTIEVTQEATAEAIPIIVTPTATPSALLSLKWIMMTVKSPLTFYKSYQIFYPSTWSIKTYKNIPGKNESGSSTLTLVKGPAAITISQASGDAGICLYPGDPEIDGMVSHYADFHGLAPKDSLIWRWAIQTDTTDIPTYKVCELKSTNDFVSSTAIGSITLTGSDLDNETLDEFNYILEKLVVLK